MTAPVEQIEMRPPEPAAVGLQAVENVAVGCVGVGLVGAQQLGEAVARAVPEHWKTAAEATFNRAVGAATGQSAEMEPSDTEAVKRTVVELATIGMGLIAAGRVLQLLRGSDS